MPGWWRRRKVAGPRRVQQTSGTTAISSSTTASKHREKGSGMKDGPNEGRSSGKFGPKPSKSPTNDTEKETKKFADVVAKVSELEANLLSLARAQDAVPDHEAEEGQAGNGQPRNCDLESGRVVR